MATETDLIAIIADACGADRDDVVLDIGDDAAVVRPRPGHELVLCTDTLVAGVHFPDDTPAGAVGHKALAVNLSDLAAMGAEPCWALLALTLPDPDETWVRGFANGFSELARLHGVKLVGGDTTRGPLSVTVQAVGQVPAGAALTRRGARRGDALFVTGTLGDAALALAEWQAGGERDPALRERLDRPTPRVALGTALRGVAHAAIDVSDGLLLDLARMLGPDGLGAVLETKALPRSAAFARRGGTVEMQLHGGDDYELLFAAPAEARIPDGCTRVGTVEDTRGLREGDGTPLAVHGYEPFS